VATISVSRCKCCKTYAQKGLIYIIFGSLDLNAEHHVMLSSITAYALFMNIE